jgi:hypothetical protein
MLGHRKTFQDCIDPEKARPLPNPICIAYRSLGDKIGTSLAAIADSKIFKISAGHRFNPPRGLTKGTARDG